MWRYSTVAIVLFLTTFSKGQEECIQLTTTSCDSPQQPIHLPTAQYIRGKAGPKGDQGEGFDPSVGLEIKRDVILIKNTLEDIQSRLLQVERYNELFTMRLRRTPRKGNLDEARRMCLDMGGDLLQRCLFTDKGHNFRDEIFNFVRSEEHWIGATDRDIEGTWKFVNGDPFPATTTDLVANWRRGEPDNWKGAGRTGEDCSQIFIWNGVMVINDLPCSSSRYGICEIQTRN